MAKSETKLGSLLSYFLILLNSLYGLVITPYILGVVGKSEYGVYQTIAAMMASVAVLEFGIGSTTQRYLARYIAQGDQKSCFNFSAMALIQTCVMSIVMGAVCFVLYFTLDSAYGNAFTVNELSRAKQIYVVLSFYVVLHIYENALWGIISGYNKFIFSNSLKIFALVLKVILYFIILPIIKNALAIVIINVIMEIIIISIEYIYIKRNLNHTIKLYQWSSNIFKESFVYSLLLFVQAVIIQFNGNVDNMLIGAMIGTTAVTIYSFSIAVFGMFESFSMSISSVLLPTVTNFVIHGAGRDDVEKLVIKYGRVQWIVMGCVLFGFICYGKEFYSLLLGEGFEDCYYLSLILMVPVIFPLTSNTCLAILKVKNLLGFRTIALGYAAIVNFVVTYIGLKYYGYWAAAAGTAISTIISGVISLNIYYQYKLKIRMLLVYLNIFKRTTLCLILTAIPCYYLNVFIGGSWFWFVTKIAVFMCMFLLLMHFYGFNNDEKKTFNIKELL